MNFAWSNISNMRSSSLLKLITLAFLLLATWTEETLESVPQVESEPLLQTDAINFVHGNLKYPGMFKHNISDGNRMFGDIRFPWGLAGSEDPPYGNEAVPAPKRQQPITETSHLQERQQQLLIPPVPGIVIETALVVRQF